jgi:hypothetical protein
MIQGQFGNNDELFFEIELIADKGIGFPVNDLNALYIWRLKFHDF